MPHHPPVTIDIVSDVMCPWCYIGRERLGEALKTVPDIPVEIRWRPFQLDPTLPEKGKDRETYLNEKFGGAERARQIYQKVEEAGASVGISFDFDAIKVSPNTLDAHRAIRWASMAAPGAQDRLVRRLFALYFEEGANIGDHQVLTEAARDSGLDSALIETLLASEADCAEVQAEIATAQEMGITGVPCFLLEGRYAIMGAQDPATLADAIAKVAQAKADGTLHSNGTTTG